MVEMINTTPHRVVLKDDYGDAYCVSEPEPDYQIRLQEERKKKNPLLIQGGRRVNLSYKSYSGANLPPPIKGRYYIVSSLVAQAFPERPDFIVPDELVRDDEGNVIGCKSFATYSNMDYYDLNFKGRLKETKREVIKDGLPLMTWIVGGETMVLLEAEESYKDEAVAFINNYLKGSRYEDTARAELIQDWQWNKNRFKVPNFVEIKKKWEEYKKTLPKREIAKEKIKTIETTYKVVECEKKEYDDGEY